jgi:hypothetical protein
VTLISSLFVCLFSGFGELKNVKATEEEQED